MTGRRMPQNVFEIQNLSFCYEQETSRNRHWAIDRLDAIIPSGTVLGIIGPNGSGKTSLLKLFMGLLRPQKGEIRLFGQDVTKLSPSTIARSIAMVPQDSPQIFPFTLGQLVLMGRFPFHRLFDGWGWDAAKDIELATASIQNMGIQSLTERMMTEVSGGERQRALIARALTQEPRVLLLDEPTAFLDLHHQVDIARKLKQLNRERGLTVIMVSHDLNLASQCCDQLLLLHDGKVVKRGTPAEVICPEVLEPVYHCQILVDRLPQMNAPRVTLVV